ncbi:MAG: serine hydrolase [Pseudomonadota bacterium]|nr:serine hydrolase [Pseudomonadota bacterium]
MRLRWPGFASLGRAALAAALVQSLAPLAVAQAAAEPARPPAAPAFELEADVTRVMRLFEIPGVAVAIVKDGRVVTARGFGVRTLGSPEPVDGQTLFEMASNSKAFTTVLLAMLVDEGKLAWDDPVIKHLPDFQMFDPYVTREMTVRDLLVHRSGLGLGAGDLLWWPTTSFSADEIIERLRHVRPASGFRSGYAYDNVLYIVAAKIVAAKLGRPWGQAVHERILGPLGMTATTTRLAENTNNTNKAAAHSRIGERPAVVKQIPVANAAGAVGINSNAVDMAKWLTSLLEGGRIPGSAKELYSARQAREMWSAQTPIRISEPKPALAGLKANFSAYGLGFALRDYKGRLIVQHTGTLQGFHSRVVLVPQEKLGFAILTNGEESSAVAALQFRLLDHYLQAAPTDWIARFHDLDVAAHTADAAAQKQASATRAASGPSLPLASYDGDFVDPWYGVVTIRAVDGQHVMAFSRTADLVGMLEHYQYDTFIVRWNQRNLRADAYVTFALLPDGSIERMKMRPISSETDFSYDFADLDFVPVKK